MFTSEVLINRIFSQTVLKLLKPLIVFFSKLAFFQPQ